MNFLIDNAMSPQLADLLRNAGHDAVHVRDYGMAAAKDEAIFNRALLEQRIIVSFDAHFGRLLAFQNTTKPSVIIFRLTKLWLPDEQALVLLNNLPQVATDLDAGCLIIEDARLRIRKLPMMDDSP